MAAVFGLLIGTIWAQQEQMVAGQIRAIKVAGDVWQVTKSSGQRARLKEGDFFRQGNGIETAANGEAILLFDNGSTINLQPNTSFTIEEFLRDPFDAQKVDYKNIKKEPSQSVTKVKVQEGTIYFDIPKLARTSTYELSNPVGTAGIRGTAGFIARNSMGLSQGSAQVRTKTGQNQSLGAGQATGFTPQGNFGPPPNNATQKLQGARNNSQNVSQSIPPKAFVGAPQSQPPAQQANLTPEQKEAIKKAAEQSKEALVQTVKEIAAKTPEAAASAAAAAAAFVPDAAPQIAAAAAAAVPQGQASALAPQIAAAVAQAVPSSAPAIAGAVAGSVPSQAAAIAQSVAQVAPTQAGNIASAVSNAAPNADKSAVNQAAQQGAQQAGQGNTQGGSSGSGSGGGTPPAMSGGFGGGGGGGSGGNTGGGPIYGK